MMDFCKLLLSFLLSLNLIVNVESCGEKNPQCNYGIPFVLVESSDINITDYISWQEAEDYCQNNFGTHLASIHNESEQDYAMYVCQQSSSRNLCWIGANDQSNETAWSWIDETNFNYSNWNDNEPSGNDDEDCIYIDPESNYKWNDFNCSGINNNNINITAFLCQNPDYNINEASKCECQSCSISGDPHIMTFDKLLYHFAGSCTYYYVKNCNDSDNYNDNNNNNNSMVPFEVLGHHQPCLGLENETSSCLQYLLVNLYDLDNNLAAQINMSGDYIAVYTGLGSLGWNGSVEKYKYISWDNTSEFRLTETQSQELDLSIYLTNREIRDARIQLSSDFGESRWYASADIWITEYYEKKFCGLCGYFDGNSSNDFAIYSNNDNNALTFLSTNNVGNSNMSLDTWYRINTFSSYWLSEDENEANCTVSGSPPSTECVTLVAPWCEQFWNDHCPCISQNMTSLFSESWYQNCIWDTCATCKPQATMINITNGNQGPNNPVTQGVTVRSYEDALSQGCFEIPNATCYHECILDLPSNNVEIPTEPQLNVTSIFETCPFNHSINIAFVVDISCHVDENECLWQQEYISDMFSRYENDNNSSNIIIRLAYIEYSGEQYIKLQFDDPTLADGASTFSNWIINRPCNATNSNNNNNTYRGMNDAISFFADENDTNIQNIIILMSNCLQKEKNLCDFEDDLQDSNIDTIIVDLSNNMTTNDTLYQCITTNNILYSSHYENNSNDSLNTNTMNIICDAINKFEREEWGFETTEVGSDGEGDLECLYNNNLDIVLVMDESCSINNIQCNNEISFIKNIIQEISDKNTLDNNIRHSFMSFGPEYIQSYTNFDNKAYFDDFIELFCSQTRNGSILDNNDDTNSVVNTALGIAIDTLTIENNDNNKLILFVTNCINKNNDNNYKYNDDFCILEDDINDNNIDVIIINVNNDNNNNDNDNNMTWNCTNNYDILNINNNNNNNSNSNWSNLVDSFMNLICENITYIETTTTSEPIETQSTTTDQPQTTYMNLQLYNDLDLIFVIEKYTILTQKECQEQKQFLISLFLNISENKFNSNNNYSLRTAFIEFDDNNYELFNLESKYNNKINDTLEIVQYINDLKCDNNTNINNSNIDINTYAALMNALNIMYNQNRDNKHDNLIILLSHREHNMLGDVCDLRNALNDSHAETVIVNIGPYINQSAYSCLVNNDNNLIYIESLNNTNDTDNIIDELLLQVFESPTSSPTLSPTFRPTVFTTSSSPTLRPSPNPTLRPTRRPTVKPSHIPAPTMRPTPSPTDWGNCLNAYAYDSRLHRSFDDIISNNSDYNGWSNGPFTSNGNDKNRKMELISITNDNDNDNGNNGLLLGYVYVMHDDDCHIYLNYELFSESDTYGFLETHVYVGNQTLYFDGYQYQTNFGHYPYSEIYQRKTQNPNVYIYQPYCNGTEYYIVAHAIVCGPFRESASNNGSPCSKVQDDDNDNY